MLILTPAAVVAMSMSLVSASITDMPMVVAVRHATTVGKFNRNGLELSLLTDANRSRLADAIESSPAMDDAPEVRSAALELIAAIRTGECEGEYVTA